MIDENNKTRAAFRNRAGIHANEAWRRQLSAWRLAPYQINPRPKPVGILEPLQGRALRGLPYRLDEEGTDHTRRRFAGGPFKRATPPAKRRKRRRH